MPKLNHRHRFISNPNCALKLLRLYQGRCVKDVSSSACNEVCAWIVFVRLVRYFFAGDHCIGSIVLANEASALSIESHKRLRYAIVRQRFRRDGDVLCMCKIAGHSDKEY